ncbi:hypothetical protein NIES39_K03520 [Arthrospira platensis NIES-39]|nr:hypothetical protein NIES39_K03520 [Arthrospira platensis NIES-39]
MKVSPLPQGMSRWVDSHNYWGFLRRSTLPNGWIPFWVSVWDFVKLYDRFS